MFLDILSSVDINTGLLSVIAFLVSLLIALISVIWNSIVKKIDILADKLTKITEDNIHNKKDIESLKEANMNFHNRISNLENKIS